MLARDICWFAAGLLALHAAGQVYLLVCSKKRTLVVTLSTSDRLASLVMALEYLACSVAILVLLHATR